VEIPDKRKNMNEEIASSVNPATGFVDVDKDVFDDPIEEGVEEIAPQQTESEPQHQTTVQQENGSQEPNNPQIVQPEKDPAQQQPQQQEERTYAGKFKSVEDLRHAFVNLGGNPNKFKSDEALEEAYEVRQSEFSRVRQEAATIARLEQPIQNPNNTTPNQTGNPLENPEALLDQVEWDKVENARDLGRELLKVVAPLMQQPQIAMPSESELVDRIMPVMQQREAAQRELQAIETEVPRLKLVEGQENPFRNAFAMHVKNEKQSGSFSDLRTSMKNFLSWAEDISTARAAAKVASTEAKVDAAPTDNRGEGLPNGQADEVDSIIGAFKSRQDKFSF